MITIYSLELYRNNLKFFLLWKQHAMFYAILNKTFRWKPSGLFHSFTFVIVVIEWEWSLEFVNDVNINRLLFGWCCVIIFADIYYWARSSSVIRFSFPFCRLTNSTWLKNRLSADNSHTLLLVVFRVFSCLCSLIFCGYFLQTIQWWVFLILI